MQIIQSLSTSTIFIKEEKINFRFKNDLQFLVKLSKVNIVKTENLETEITFPKIGHRLTTRKTHIVEAV